MKKIVTTDYRRALRLSLIFHAVILIFAAVDIFNLFNQRPIEVAPDVSLVTEADLRQIQRQIKQNQKQIKEEKIAEPEKSEPKQSKFISAMALINKNIKELSEPEPQPEPAPKAEPKPAPAKPKEDPKPQPSAPKPKIDKIDLSSLVIDSSQENEVDNDALREIEESTKKIAQNIADNSVKPIEAQPESEPEIEVEEIEPETTEIEPETVEEEIEIVQEIIEQDVTPQEVIIKEAITVDEEQLSSNLESDLDYQELVVLREQIGTCWSSLSVSGAENIEDLIVRIQVELNEQGVLTTARILHRFGADINDPSYIAATESALRAVRHPNCTPLKLPVDKYDIWKKTILTFRPTL